MHDWNEYADDRGVVFFWRVREDGHLDVRIMGDTSPHAAAFMLTVDHIAWMHQAAQAALAQQIAQHTADTSPNSD